MFGWDVDKEKQCLIQMEERGHRKAFWCTDYSLGPRYSRVDCFLAYRALSGHC